MSKRDNDLLNIAGFLFIIALPFMLIKGILDILGSIFNSSQQSSAENEYKERLKSMRELLRLDVQEHYNTLCNKRAMLCYTDDYGNYIEDDWVKELKYYLKKFFEGDEDLLTDDTFTAWRNEIEIVLDELKFEDGYVTPTVKKDLISPESYKNGYEFEAVCKQLLERYHYSARVTSKSGDQGVDVIARKEGKEIAIQCKLYSQPVGNKAVQEVAAGMNYYKSNYAAVITNNQFTKSAKQLAKNCSVILLNINELGKLDDILGFQHTEIEESTPTYEIDKRIPIFSRQIGETLYRIILTYILKGNRISTTSFQKEFGIQFATANKIMDRLQNEKIVSQYNSDGKISLLKTLDEIIEDTNKKKQKEKRQREQEIKQAIFAQKMKIGISATFYLLGGIVFFALGSIMIFFLYTDSSVEFGIIVMAILFVVFCYGASATCCKKSPISVKDFLGKLLKLSKKIISFIRVHIKSFLILLVAYFIYALVTFTYQYFTVALKSVSVMGNNRTTKKEISSVLNLEQGKPMYKISKRDIQENLQKLPWIQKVSVERNVFAGRIKIYIKEKNELNGIISTYYENGNIATKGEYEHSLRNGLWKEYYKNGKLKNEGSYQDDKEAGIWKFYYENGKLQAEGNAKEGKLDGLWKNYYENGNIMIERFYNDGKENGIEKSYDENGILDNEIPMKNDKKDGVAKWFWEDGSFCETIWKNDEFLSRRCKDKDGKNIDLNGNIKFYYKNGKLHSECSYKNGKREGECKSYYASGTLRRIRFFESEKLDGEVKNYDMSGKLIKIENYKNGKYIGYKEIE